MMLHAFKRTVCPPAIAALAIAAIMASAVAAAGKQFADYPASETFSGAPAPMDASTAPQQWSAVRQVIKDIIHDDMAKGPNFAGAYFLATVGCGTGCEVIFVIDLRTGVIYVSPDAASNDVLFQKDSRLIIIKENKFFDLPRSFQLFENGKFNPVE